MLMTARKKTSMKTINLEIKATFSLDEFNDSAIDLLSLMGKAEKFNMISKAGKDE